MITSETWLAWIKHILNNQFKKDNCKADRELQASKS